MGDSNILRKLTKATPEVAPYPFTTGDASPGMMDWEDVRCNSSTCHRSWTFGYACGRLHVHLARRGDPCGRPGRDDGPFAAETVLERLASRKIQLVSTPPEVEGPDDLSCVAGRQQGGCGRLGSRLDILKG